MGDLYYVPLPWYMIWHCLLDFLHNIWKLQEIVNNLSRSIFRFCQSLTVWEFPPFMTLYWTKCTGPLFSLYTLSSLHKTVDFFPPKCLKVIINAGNTWYINFLFMPTFGLCHVYGCMCLRPHHICNHNCISFLCIIIKMVSLSTPPRQTMKQD